MLPKRSIRENMTLYVNIAKQTFFLQKFVQTGCGSEVEYQRTTSFNQQL